MSIVRDDRWLTDAQGNALAGAQVYYCTQPAVTTTIPPSPLATVYTDTAGDTGVNPVVTDGFGHSVAYIDNSVLYTIVFVHPLFGSNPVVLTDQAVTGSGGGGVSLIPFAGVPSGTVNGVNATFTLTNGGIPLTVAPTQVTVWQNVPLVKGYGFTISGFTITYAHPPTVTDVIYAQGFHP